MFEALLDRLRPNETGASLVVNLLLAGAVVIIGTIIARLLRRRLIDGISRTKGGYHLGLLLGNAALFIVLAVTLLFVLRVFGLDASALVAVVGVSTAAIGLALQDMLKNLFAGIYLLIERPFQIGDTIVVDSREGEVERLNLRTTVVRVSDGTQAMIPNAVVFATTVMNRSTQLTRRVSFRLEGLEHDPQLIENRLRAVVHEQPDLVATPEPRIRVEAIVDGKATIVLDLWRPANRPLAPGIVTALHKACPGAAVRVLDEG